MLYITGFVFKYINEKIQVKAGEIENGHIFEQ